MKNPIKFEIAFQFPFKKNSDNVRNGLLKLKKMNVRFASMDWVLFYKYLCKCMSPNNPTKSQLPPVLVLGHPGQALDKEVDPNNNSMSQESPSNTGTETCNIEPFGQYQYFKCIIDEQKMTEEEVLTKLHQKTQKWYVHLKLAQTRETTKYIGNM